MPLTIPVATKIMVIRHAEKPPKPPTNPQPNPVNIYGVVENSSLIVQGWQRAGALATLFAPSRGPLQDPLLATPQFIFASAIQSKGGKKNNDNEENRPEETVTPLIDKLKLTPDFKFAKTDISDEAGVVAAAVACAGVVLISWPHGMIPKLAAQIPPSTNNKKAIPTKWPGTRYDMVWVFDLDTTSEPVGYIFHQVPQLLLAGDSHKPIK